MDRHITVIFIAMGIGLAAVLCRADTFQAPESPGPSSPHQPERLLTATQWGGHVRTAGTVAWPDRQSRPLWENEPNLYDGFLQLRLKNDLFFGSNWTFQTHYEAVAMAGDTLEKSHQWQEQWPNSPVVDMLAFTVIDDDRRLMDLTHVIHAEPRDVVYHRLDRLNLTLTRPWGMVRLGRQALTWGNGLVFHPMDLFNPFAPTAIIKEYKIGDDMAMAQLPTGLTGNLQALYLPRRNLATTDVEWDQSSLAGKWHLSTNTIEIDAMAAHHFADTVIGIGATGYFREAAWRTDLTWTFLDGNGSPGSYLSAVANIDYAWTWWNKNSYGFLEFYFNGLGSNDFGNISDNVELMTRIGRGELFVLGRIYLAGGWQVEVHPLVRISLTTINNLADPSGLLQPQIVWDMTTNVQLVAVVRWHYGEKDSEFGGYRLRFFDDDVFLSPSNSAFLQLTRYF